MKSTAAAVEEVGTGELLGTATMVMSSCCCMEHASYRATLPQREPTANKPPAVPPALLRGSSLAPAPRGVRQVPYEIPEYPPNGS